LCSSTRVSGHGTLLKILCIIGTPREFDFVDIECKGETLAVFNRDIEERTEEL
jgi:hypothetical protein